MSSYALEEALRDFIENAISETDRFASDNHEHNESSFEDKVTEYLGEGCFRVNEGCRVQRAFEWSVRAVIEDWVQSSSSPDILVRQMLQSILAKARSLPGDLSVNILIECNARLAEAIRNQPLPQEAAAPEAVPTSN